MTNKVTISLEENLPMPLIYLASAEDLAQWHVGQLQWAYGQGQRELAISCFDTAAMGFPVGAAACAVLRAVMDFLYDHGDVAALRVLCGGESAYRAYSFHWNMWYAERKPAHDH